MLSLQINGQYCDLNDDFSFTMNLKSPVFSSDTGSASYPFKIPNTERNARLMGFKHRVENTGDVYQEAQGTFLWDEKILFQGTLKMKILNSKSFEGAIYEGNGDFNYQKKNLSLQQVNYGEMDLTDEATACTFINSIKSARYPDQKIAFPQLQNELYYDPPATDPELEYMNQYTMIGIRHLSMLENRTIVVPMVYLRHVLDKVFAYIGYTLDDAYFKANPDFNDCVLYNSVNCNEGPGGIFDYAIDHLYFSYHVPRMSLNDFFTAFENFFNIRLFVNNNTKVIRIISVENIVTATAYIEFSKNIISLNTELEEQPKGFHLKMSVDSGDSDFDAYKAVEEDRIKKFKEPVDKISDLPVWPGAEEMEVRYVKATNLHYYYNSSTKQWVVYSHFTENYLWTQTIVRQIDKVFETKMSFLVQDGSYCHCGNKRDDWRDVTPRLFFVWNDADGVYGEIYRNDNLLVGGGRYQHNYKNYIDFLFATKLVKITKQLTMIEIRDLDFSKKYMINGTRYLVKSVQVNFKRDRIMPAILDCYVCN